MVMRVYGKIKVTKNVSVFSTYLVFSVDFAFEICPSHRRLKFLPAPSIHGILSRQNELNELD